MISYPSCRQRVSVDGIFCTPEVTLVPEISNIYPNWRVTSFGIVPESEIVSELDIITESEIVFELMIVPKPNGFPDHTIVPNPESISELDILPLWEIILDPEIFKPDVGTDIIESAGFSIKRPY